MRDVIVVNRAAGQKPKGPWAGLKVLTDSIVGRLRALENRPAAADGKDGLPGRDGIDGKSGIDGQAGRDGKDGRDGQPGRDGKDGVSLIKTEIAADGCAILHLSNGSTLNLGKIIGPAGRDGVDGKHGNDGAPGRDGNDGRDGINAENGKDGLPGERGEPGIPGRDGAAGRSIVGTSLNGAGELVIQYSDETETNVGRIVGRDGKDGIGGERGEPGGRGEPGAPGRDGVDGKDGRSFSTAALSDAGELVITLSDGETITLGRIVGRDGEPGARGEPGKDGRDGDAGESGRSGIDGKDGRDGRDGRAGRSIVKGDVVDGKLVLQMSDGETEIVGLVRGEPGARGEPGPAGEPGAPGIDGKAGRDGRPGAQGKPGIDGEPAVQPIAIAAEDEEITLTADQLRGLRVRRVRIDGVELLALSPLE